VTEQREDLRAADVDRQFVADRLKSALDEGRLSLHEYDDRLREAYAARTYGDLDRLMADLPGAERAHLVPPPPVSAASPKPSTAAGHPAGRGFPRWIFAAWSGWLTTAIILNVIYLVTDFGGRYWPGIPLGIWGAFLLVGTINGLVWGGRGGWGHKAARRRERDQRRRERRGH
jgi:hypothetical protein